ncbi:MAG: hypothetical protein QGG90_04305, partial [Nitrospinota bacterium]|nr:hypothetical protein [Nitrospinota bacterium]
MQAIVYRDPLLESAAAFPRDFSNGIEGSGSRPLASQKKPDPGFLRARFRGCNRSRRPSEYPDAGIRAIHTLEERTVHFPK